MSRRRVTSVLQDWVRAGRRISSIRFLSEQGEFECVLFEAGRRARSWRAQARTLQRTIELALLKARAAGA